MLLPSLASNSVVCVADNVGEESEQDRALLLQFTNALFPSKCIWLVKWETAKQGDRLSGSATNAHSFPTAWTTFSTRSSLKEGLANTDLAMDGMWPPANVRPIFWRLPSTSFVTVCDLLGEVERPWALTRDTTVISFTTGGRSRSWLLLIGWIVEWLINVESRCLL